MALCGVLQANTAVTITLGPFLDDDDALTEKTGLTILDTTVYISKNGGAKANPNDTDDCAEDANGVYTKALNTTDTNAEGILTVYVHESDALYVRQDYLVLAQAAYISFFTAKDTGFMGVDAVAISTDVTAANNLELFTEVLENGTGLIDNGTFKAGAIDASAIANAAIDNATFAADVGSTAHGTNIIALACRKILEELNLDHLLKVDTTVAAAGDLSTYVVNGSVLSHVMTNSNTSDYNSSTDALQPLRDHIGDGTNLDEAGGDGAQLTAINLPNQTMDITGNLSGSVGSLTGHTNQTGDNFAIVNGTAGLVAIDTVVDAIKAVTDNMAAAATTLVEGTVSWDNTNATTTVIYSDDITEATADHFNGRIIIFTSGALQNQATDITDYALDTGEGKFTVTATTEAAADDTTFVIV